MIALLQRVSQGKVAVDGTTAGEIGRGLVIFLGVFRDDEEEDGEFLARKISTFRIFDDASGKMNLSMKEVGGTALVVSQFTLCADWLRGRRPSFVKAAPPEKGERLYNHFIARLTEGGVPVQSGVFGAMMKVTLINDGPVTFVLDSNARS
ncbi:MAG: D-aminoacyl-tRNA deacylase [Fidelibacterota bacterium]